MRVPLEWLKEFVDFPFSPEELALKLTMVGLEVEGIEKAGDDTVLEVNVTPNRPDCLSILGVAREVSAVLKVPVRLPECRVREEAGESSVLVEIIDEDLCHRYAGRDIRGVTLGDSPEWMKKRLEKCGMRPINNIVDITNYVLLEMGHPLHAFDMDTLRGGRIRVGRSGAGRTITTLDGANRLLPEDALLIWDGERPVAVAGVMGGAETEVKEGTRNIFLESAFFLPASIRRTSRGLGLKTESSFRFERGTDIEFLEKAMDRAASLMAQLAGGRVSGKVDVYPRPFRAQRIEVRYQRVNKILGVSAGREEMIDLVERLGMAVTVDRDSFSVTPPSFRGDVQREIDVIEEIARLFGYDRIPVTVPRVPVSEGAKDRKHRHLSAVRQSFRGAGFTEAINYSFMNPAMLDMLNIGRDDPRRRTITMRNPLNEEESCLRTTLVPSLIRNLSSNITTGSREVRLFEISRVFVDRGTDLPEEAHLLGAIYFRDRAPALWKEDAPDFYIMKGAVQATLDDLRMTDYAFNPSSEPFLHPGRSADITVSGRRIGFLGILHPDIVERLSLKVSRPDIIIAEISLDELLPLVPEAVKYEPIPRFPHIERDVALIVDESLPSAAVMEHLRSYPTGLIEEVSVFDCYKGKNIPEGKKSLAFAVRYRAKDRTLTDSEIEELHTRLVAFIVERTGGTVRGA